MEHGDVIREVNRKSIRNIVEYNRVLRRSARSIDPSAGQQRPSNPLRSSSATGFSQGLAMNLHELGIPDKVIQAILRHEDVKTTQRSYIKAVPSVVTEAMRRLEQRIACAAGFGQLIPKLLKVWSRGRELKSRPADYEKTQPCVCCCEV